MPLPTFTTKTDALDIIYAADINNLQNEVAPTAAAALAVRYSTVHTSTATTLTDASFPLQSISSTAAGTVTLPAASTANHAFFVVNRNATNSLTVNNASAAFVAFVRPDSAGVFFPDSTAGWYGLSLPKFSTSTSPVNVLREDGKFTTDGIGIPRFICKPSIETVNNSTVFQSDDDFTFPIEASAVYLASFYLMVTDASNGTADIQFQFSVPASCTYSFGTNGTPTGQAAFSGVLVANTPVSLSTTLLSLGTATGPIGIALTAIIVNSTNSGTCVLQWAQNTLSATNLSIQPNSVMEYVRVK